MRMRRFHPKWVAPGNVTLYGGKVLDRRVTVGGERTARELVFSDARGFRNRCRSPE